jgi:uncharacterized protein YkwD
MAKIKSHGTDSHKTKPRNVNKKAFERVYWPYLPLVFAVSLLLTLSTNAGALQAAVRHHTIGKVLSYATSMSLSGLLADTNAARSSNGIGPLSLNSKLDAAAQANADDMAARDYWSHYTPEGNPPWVWVDNQGYAYQALAQNLATGFSDEQSTVNGWMASPPHRENLLNGTYTEVGFGFANNPNYTAAGGGPQTIVVAFYGEPKVLAAQTTVPATTTPDLPSSPAPSTSQTPAATPPSSEQTQSTAPAAGPAPGSDAKQAATTSTPKKNLTPSTSTSNLQLAAPSARYGSSAAKLSVVLAIVIIGLWANRHIRALHRFLVKGERYAIRHPLTDLGVMMMAALLFILSQTAGLIQ